MGKIKGAVAGKTLSKKVTVEHCRLNPAMQKIMIKRAKEKAAREKGFDINDVSRQVNEFLRKEDTDG